jgi:quinol monooxygenase YgiN
MTCGEGGSVPGSWERWPIVIVKITRIMVKPEKRVELVQTISRLLGPIKNVKGCRTIRFYLDAADENSSLLLSEWETESDLERYIRSNDFAILRGAIMVLSVGTTDSKTYTASESVHDLVRAPY